jgi:hypothetical membrane protein
VNSLHAGFGVYQYNKHEALIIILSLFGKLMRLIYFSVFYLIAVIICAHFFVPQTYSWVNNTISDLASQGMPYQWIMQIGFIGFGLLLCIGLIAKAFVAQRVIYSDVLIILYGLSVLVTGLFSAQPFIEGVPYSPQEAKYHSIFASLAGIFLTAGIFISLFMASNPGERVFHLIFLILVVGLSAAFGLVENGVIPIGKGLLQRVLWVTSFSWLLVSQYESIQRLG